MKKTNIVSLAAISIAVTISHSAIADTVNNDGNNQENSKKDIIIVKGKSIEKTLPQELSKYGHDIETITEAEIKTSGAIDAATALKSVPGLYIKPRSGPFSYADISIQGSRTQDVLWTVDGIRINNRLYGSTSPNDTLPASMIERVEILKGGEGLFYGTQASSGIINVVTRGFTDNFNGELNLKADTHEGSGIDGYIRDSLGKHRFVAYGSYNKSKGYDLPFSRMEPSATDRNYGYENWSVGGKYQYNFTDDLALNIQYQHTDAMLDNLSAIQIKKSYNHRDEEVASIRLDYTGNDKVQFFLKGYYHDWDTDYAQIRNSVTSPGTEVVVYPKGTYWGYQDFGGSALVKLHLNKGLEYLIGYDYQNFNGKDDVLLIAKKTEKVNAGIFQIRTNDEFSTKAHLAAGLRYNKSGGTDTTIWNITGRYDFANNIYTEANLGTSFILPDAYQLYAIDPWDAAGNPDLEAEESKNFNASFGGKLNYGDTKNDWKITYFKRDITNLIDVDYSNPIYLNGKFANIDSKVKSEGLELLWNTKLENDIKFGINYTYSQTRNEGSKLQRNRIPEQYANAHIGYMPDNKPYGVNLSFNWVGDVYSTPTGFGRKNYGKYTIANLDAYYFIGNDRKHRLGINIENLFDKEYSSSGYGVAVTDAGYASGDYSKRFLYYSRGVPRTIRFNYGIRF